MPASTSVFCVEGRRRGGVIVLASGAAAPEAFAAEELRRYVKRLTGAAVPVAARAPCDDARFALSVGEAAWACVPRAASLRRGLSDDGFVLYADARGLAIAGASPRGTLNGVYHFLAEQGCRWLFPGSRNEIVPRRKTLRIEPGTRREQPDLELRGICFFGMERRHLKAVREVLEWMSKNRLNTVMTSLNRPAKYMPWAILWKEVGPALLPEIKKRGMILDISEHQMVHFFPPSHCRRHPEWYAANAAGVRVKPSAKAEGWQICYSNPGAVRALGDAMVAYLREHREAQIIGTWPNDGYGFCQCPGCRRPGAVLKAINAVAARIERARPDVTVEYLSYTRETSEVPDSIAQRRNVSVLVANPRVAPAWLAKSRRTGARGVYRLDYSLADNSAQRGHLPLFFDYAARTCHDTREGRMRGILPFYIGLDSWWRSGLNLYAMGRCAWNADTAGDDLIRDCCRTLYGPAAPAMAPVLAALSRKVPRAVPPAGCKDWRDWKELPELLSDAAWRRWERTRGGLVRRLAAARARAGSAPVRARIRTAAAYLAFSDAWLRAFRARALAVRALPDDPGAAVRLIREAGRQERELLRLNAESVRRGDGVNGVRPAIRFFQRMREAMDRRLIRAALADAGKAAPRRTARRAGWAIP